MSAKDVSASTCLGILEKIQTVLPNDKILEGANNFQKPADIPSVIDGLDKAQQFFKSVQSYVDQSILKPSSDCQDKFIVLTHQDDAFNEMNVLSALCALAYDKGDTACLEKIANHHQYHVGVGHLMNNLGVMFSERMEYKKSETCFVRAKSCFVHEHDHLGNAVATLNLAVLHQLFGDYQSALSCCEAAASLCHDISMRTTKDVHLPWKVLRRVAGLFQEFGNYKRCQDVLHIGVFYDISSASEASTVLKQLMTLQLKEQNGEKIQGEELEDLASHLLAILDQSCTDNLPGPKTNLMNADLITLVVIVAKMYRDIDHLKEACQLLENLETSFLLVHGRKHLLYGSLLYQIGSFKLGAGKTAEAVKALQQAEAIFIHYFGKGHHMVASCKSLLGTCALVKGQTREASTHLNEALALFKKMNHCHPEVAEILLKLAFMPSEEGNFQSAKTTVQEAVDIFISACGEVSPKTGSAYFQAAAILQKAGESRAAVDKVKKAIDIFLQLGLQCDHPDVKACRSLLGALQLSLGQVKEAEEQFSEVQQQVPLQDEPCLTAGIIAPEITNMFLQAKTDCGTGRYMGSCLGAQVVSLVNLVHMKIGEERRNHMNTLLSCLQRHETEEPQILDFAGQTVYFTSPKVWMSDRLVYFMLTSAPLPDCLQTARGQNSDYASWKSDSNPNVFLLSPSICRGKKPCSLVVWKTSKVLEMKELSSVGSAFRESVNMLFLQPKFRKGYLEGQDVYLELTLPKDPCPEFSLCAQIDFLPLLVELKLSEPHKESGNSVVHNMSLISAVEPSTHVSYFSYRFSSQRLAEFVFDNLIVSLGHTLALTRVGADEIFNASSMEDGVFFLFLEPNNSSLSVVVEKESVVVKCRTVNEFESPCICSLVKNTLDGTMESLCHVVRVKFEASVQLPCGDYLKESANCSCGCRGFQRESSSSSHSLETLDSHAHVRSQEPKSDHVEGKPSADVLQNENEEDILFSGHPVDKISTEVCVSLLECLLSNRHVSSEWQQSGTGEMLSTDAPPLDDSTHLTESTLLSPGSTSSLSSLPTSPSNPMFKMPDFLQNMSPSLVKVEDEPCDEKDDSNTVQLSENSTMACAGCNESSLTLQEKLSNSSVRDNLQDCSAMRSSYEEGLPSGESFNDAETTETVQLKDGTGLSEEEIWILKSEVAFSHNQCYELRKQMTELKEQLQQCEAEKQQLELEFGRISFLEDKQKRSKKFLPSTRAHVSEQSTSCTANSASYAFTSMEGKLLGGASPEPGFSLQGRLLEISNSLSEVELKRMKLLAKPKVNAFRLKKIREGIELFEELETRGELSYTYVKELLEGIQRFDLVQKLGVPLHDRAGTGRPIDQRMLDKIQCKESPDEDCSSSPALVVIPSEDKKLDVFPKRHDSAAKEPSDGMHLQGDEENDMESGINKADSGCNISRGSSENSGGDKAVLSLSAGCDDSSADSESDAEEHTRVPDSFNGGFPSNENSSIAVKSSELSASSDMIAQSFSDDSPFSSCTSQDMCDSSLRATPDLPFDVKNRETAGDGSYNPTSSKEEILESSLLPNDTDEFESEDMDTTEAGAAQGGGIDEISKASGDVWDGPMKPPHLKVRCAAGVGKDVVDSGPTRFRCRPNLDHMPGLMKDALPDGDISVEQNRSGARSDVGKDSTVDHSVPDTSTQSNEWERLGARPRDRPPVKMAPLAPSLVDLVPQEVAGPVAHGVANAFLARHSQDRCLHESLYQGSVSKDTSSQGASYVDGMMSLSERNKAKPYFGECQADVHSRPQFSFPPVPGAGYDSHNAVGGYSYNGQTGLGPGPPSSCFTGSNFLVNGNLPSSSAFNSSIYNSLRSDFPLGTSRPSGVGSFDREPPLPSYGQVGSELYTSVPMNQRFHSGMTGSHFGNSSLIGAADPQLIPPVYGTQRYSGFNENTSALASELEKTKTARTANSGLGNQSSITANSDYLLSASTGNVAQVDVQLGSAGLPALTVANSNGADIRHESEAESRRTSQNALGSARNNVLNTSGDRVVETGLPSDSSRVSRLTAGANADANHAPQGTGASLLSANTGGSMLNRDFGTDSVESTDNSLLALEQRVEEACALVERVLREREEREEFGREIERKEREIREQRARKRREREARELEEASRWPQQQEPVTGRSQWLCEHYQRHCRVRFPCCSHFYSCHRCHNNSKACDNEEAKASHATHLKCSFCQHEQEIGEDSGKCRSCGAQMSAYFCTICKHFTSVDKNPYHCKKCGICRIHKDKSFHCEVCNVCLDKRLEGKHKCRPDSGHDECCICLEDAFSGCQILPCSHKVHRECAIAMIQNGIRTCPVCRHPLYSPAPE